MDSTTSAYLKRSRFIVGVVRASRGLVQDVRTLAWLLKRKGQIADYLSKHPVKKLHLGTSNNILDAWLNTDIVLNHAPVVYLDATKRFPFEDNTFEYIMAEHMIEHIDYQSAQLMLREMLSSSETGRTRAIRYSRFASYHWIALQRKNGRSAKLHRLAHRAINAGSERVQRRFCD